MSRWYGWKFRRAVAALIFPELRLTEANLDAYMNEVVTLRLCNPGWRARRERFLEAERNGASLLEAAQQAVST